VVGGIMTDYVIRFETQGRGSIHAHMLLWIEIDEGCIPQIDKIELKEDVEKKYGLVIDDVKMPTGTRKLYDPVRLSYVNANIWALRDWRNIKKKMRIVEEGDVTTEYAID
jgi:hypothetical protein